MRETVTSPLLFISNLNVASANGTQVIIYSPPDRLRKAGDHQMGYRMHVGRDLMHPGTC